MAFDVKQWHLTWNNGIWRETMAFDV